MQCIEIKVITADADDTVTKEKVMVALVVAEVAVVVVVAVVAEN